jgi:hypothetical protein
MGTPGWIHTPYDNSTSTTTLDWVETADLGNHVKVAALSISRITAPLIGDITGPSSLPDGIVDMLDIDLVAGHFGETVPPAPTNCDLTGLAGVPDAKIDIKDISLVAKNFGKYIP